MVVVDCFTTLVEDEDVEELVAEKLELELLENEYDELLLVPVVVTSDPAAFCETICDMAMKRLANGRRLYLNSETDEQQHKYKSASNLLMAYTN